MSVQLIPAWLLFGMGIIALARIVVSFVRARFARCLHVAHGISFRHSGKPVGDVVQRLIPRFQYPHALCDLWRDCLSNVLVLGSIASQLGAILSASPL